jgi:predicted nucleic acid-binding protein
VSTLVADGSALGMLIQTDNVKTLPLMYDRVVIPKEVENELRKPETPETVRSWLDNPTIKVEVQDVKQLDNFIKVHKGEKEVISLGQELKAKGENVTLLIDEKKPRNTAKERGFEVLGVFGILREADREGFLNSDAEIKKIEKYNTETPEKKFRYSENIVQETRDARNGIEAKREQAGIKEVQVLDSEWRRFEVTIDGKKGIIEVNGLHSYESEKQVREILNGKVQDALVSQQGSEALRVRVIANDRNSDPSPSPAHESTSLSSELDRSPSSSKSQKYEVDIDGEKYRVEIKSNDPDRALATFLSKEENIQALKAMKREEILKLEMEVIRTQEQNQTQQQRSY